MRRNYGAIKRGHHSYSVYESDQRIITGGPFQLPTPITQGNFDSLFSADGGTNTTIVSNTAFRLDKQNTALVGFDNIPDTLFNNLSVQKENASLAVLYLEHDFIGTYTEPARAISDDVAGLRGMFKQFRNSKAGNGEKLLLRVLYTWLMVSNRVGFKICICKNQLQTGVSAPALAMSPAENAKTAAKALI